MRRSHSLAWTMEGSEERQTATKEGEKHRHFLFLQVKQGLTICRVTNIRSDKWAESSCGEEENGDHDELMGAEEEEDNKEVCIQVKLCREEKVKSSLEKYDK